MASSDTNKSPVLTDRHTLSFLTRFGTVQEFRAVWEPPSTITGGAAISGSIIESVSCICTGTGNSAACDLEFLVVRGGNTGDAARIGRLNVPTTQTDVPLQFSLLPMFTPVPLVGAESKQMGLMIPNGFGLYVQPLNTITGPGIDILAQISIY